MALCQRPIEMNNETLHWFIVFRGILPINTTKWTNISKKKENKSVKFLEESDKDDEGQVVFQ